MRVKLLKRWRGHKPGGEANFPDGMANELIRRGICEELKAEGGRRKAERKRRIRRSKPYIEEGRPPIVDDEQPRE